MENRPGDVRIAPEIVEVPNRHFLGSAREFRNDRLKFLGDSISQYGNTVAFRLGHRPFLLLNDPQHVDHVLHDRDKVFIKPLALRANRRVFGTGLLVESHDVWWEHRKVLNNDFTTSRVREYAGDMVQLTERMVDGWRDGDRRDLHREMVHLTLQIMTKSLFGTAMPFDDFEQVDQAMHAVTEGTMARVHRLFVLPEWFPSPTNIRLRRAVRQLEEILGKILASRAEQDNGSNLLGRLLHHYGPGAGMDHPQLRDQMVTMFLAAHETTANALAWTFYLLTQHPDAEARLHSELEGTPENRSAGDKMPYLEQVIYESMRLYPPIWVVAREAARDTEIGGNAVRARTTILICPWFLHRDATQYEKPEEFRPERWNDEIVQERKKNCTYIPFSTGSRQCLGDRFAIAELRLVLANIARRFRFTLADDCVVEPLPVLTLRLKYGLPVLFHERNYSEASCG